MVASISAVNHRIFCHLLETLYFPSYNLGGGKKNKRHRKSESASTSPDIRNRENGMGIVKLNDNFNNGRDVSENAPECDRNVNEDVTNQEMEESNPAFLKYLQYKV